MNCAIRINPLQDSSNSKKKAVSVMYIKKGIACIAFGCDSANTMNSGIFGEGSWLGSLMIHQPLSIHATIEELEPVEAICFPKDKIDILAKQDPMIYKWLYHATVKTQQQWLLAQVTSLHDRHTRVVFSLLEIARLTKQVQGSYTKVNASQKQLSTITGISRPRLNETLKMLELCNEISIERGSIHLIDIEKLRIRLNVLNTTIEIG
ncbi:Crp/Fnr family transcriptional regulator [Vibrio sinensis]|uniref:Crp/Fnr family transcriptional regulator n=1 Tax=Vibrio sinensis TaxID=2302434 RepID=A0A3A6Q9K2_9VIBR|nr:helix-turn-helix domain-containing protein [Vibrio sinensis]RJX67133.1 Crp/Fnr family transcriptional regulator [Vibrio sinensis]